MAIRNLQQLREKAPAEFRNLSDEDLVDKYSRNTGMAYEQAADYFGIAPRGTLREMGRQLAGGAVVDLPKMIGQGLQYTELAPKYGKEMAQAAEARAPDYAPDLRDRGLAGKVGIYGARGVAPVLGTTALMFTPGGQVTAPVVAAGLFGTSSAQETYDKILEQTGDPEAATAAARRVGLIQGVGEGAATFVGGRILKGLAPGLGGGARTTGQVATGLTDTSIAKPFLKGMAINAAVQPATEVAQDLGSYAVEQAYGAKAEDPYAIAEQSALGGLGLTLLLGPLALGSHKSRSNRSAALKDALFNPDADPMVTAKARDLVMAEAKRQGIPDSNIDAWFNRQLTIEDQRNESLRQAELQERDKQINLMGETAQGLEGLQGGMFSSLDQQRRFEQGLGAIEPSIQGPFGSLTQQQTFEEGLTAARDANIARVGGEFQDLMANRMAGQMAAQEPGQQFQTMQAQREQGLQTAQDVGAQWQEIKIDKQRTQFDIEEMGRDWQKLQAELPQPVSTALTSGQRAALRGPEGKRLKQTSSPLPARELPPATTLLPAEQAPSSPLLQQPAAPMSQLTDRPVTPEPAPASPLGGVTTAAPLPPAPAAGGVSSTPATTTQDGAQTTQAKQTKTKKQKAPIAVGSVVKVNDKEITLSQEQADAWNKAQEAYDGKARRARELTNYQEREGALRAAGMQLSAERRKITGALTGKEQEAANRVAARQTAEQRTQDDLGLTAALQTANRTNVANNPLQAGVQGADKKPVPGKTSLTVSSLRNIRDALLNPSATVEGISDKEQQIADAVRAFAKSYYKFSNAGGNMLRGIPTERAIKGENGETIYKPTKLASQTPAQQRGQIKAKTGARVSTTLDQLGATREALAGLGRAVGGNAKDVEAIVKLVKDMVQQKLHTEVNDEGMNEDFGQTDDGDDGVAQAFKKMDTMLSQGWRAAKDNMFQGVSDAAFVRQTPIRNSKEANAAASTAVTLDTPLEMAAQGYAIFGKGEPSTGLLGVLNYIQTHGTPFERTIAKGVFESLYDSDTAPKLEFITKGKPYYDPKTNTVYIQRDASAAVTLHEALHSALQWYVYQNPNAPEVRALKASLKRVVNFKGELSPDAQRVQDVLKTLVKDKKELDAVLELISYGNTLNDFRRALEAMDSTEAPKSFYDAAKNVWQSILTTVQKLVGVRPSVAADVIGNTFKLLEAAGSGKKGEAVGNRLESKISTLTDAFKNWFKDSKVVDNDGNPLVVYHGTSASFDTFEKDMLGAATGAPSARLGFFFAGDPDTSAEYARNARRTRVQSPAEAEIYYLRKDLERYRKGLADATAQRDPNSPEGKSMRDRQVKYRAKRLEEAKQKLKQDPNDSMAKWETENFATQFSETTYVDIANSYVRDYTESIAKAEKKLQALEAEVNASAIGQRAGENIMPVYISLQNPLIMDQQGARYRIMSYRDTIMKAKRDGHDGVIIKNTYDGKNQPSWLQRLIAKWRKEDVPSDTIYIAFEPNQIKSAIGNRGTYDPNSNNILEAAVESNKPVSDAKVAETLGVREQDYSRFNKSNAIQLQLTQRAFEVVGWNRANMEKLTGKAGDKMRAFISKNFPGTEILLGWINSRYNVSNTVSQTMDRYKLNKGIGYQYAEDLANVISRRPAEEVNALFAYLDGNKQALDKMPDSMKLKAVADKLNDWFKLYVAELTPVEQRYFNSRKFSENLLFPETTEQVAGNTFGLGKINEVLGLKRESETELDQDWFQKDDNGDLVTDGDVYRVFEANNLTAKGGMVPAGFISAARFAELNNVNPMGYVVDTSRKWLFEGVKDKKYSFVTNTTAKEKIANEKADDVANALRNTIAALANNYASKHFIKSVYDMGRGDNAHAQVAFDSLEAVNKAFGVNLRENQVLPISREISRSPQTKSLYRQSGTWVKLPDNSPAYGELAGKYLPGPVWNAMGDMSDRQPVIPWRAANNVMRWFKKSKTVWNFGTHVTNTASNVTMAMMHDISFSTMSTASKILAKYEASPKSLTKDELALMMAFRDSGAMLADYSSAEVKEALYKAHAENLRGGEDVSVMRRVAGWLNIEKSKAEAISRLTGKAGKFVDRADEVASQMYSAEDNIFRLAAFLKTAGALQNRAGLDAPTKEMMQEAGLFARKAFGDYDIDSKAVKIGRQTVLPFVSWVYAMAPVLGRIAVYEPWKLTNVLMAYMILEAAMGAAAGDDEEKRIDGPEALRERLFGSMGPYTHVRIPFMGDDENPVYYKLGDYFPTSTFTRGLPNGLMGQSWIPASITPSGPFVSAILGLVGGVDPYTGKSLHQPTDTEWQKLWTAAKFTYDTATIPLFNSKNIEKVNDLIDEKTGITGAEPSSLFIARAFGLKFYDYNEGEQAAINETIEKRITNEFKTAINKAKREEYRKGYPDYEELDKTLEDLQVRMQEKLDKARGVEE
jgi:hypothetical protein